MSDSNRGIIASMVDCPLLKGFGGVLSTCSESGPDANKIIIYKRPPFGPTENLVVPLSDADIESHMKNACANCVERDFHNPTFRMMRVLISRTSKTIISSDTIKEPIDTMVAVFPFILDHKY
jgi:hypothetical protein